MAGASSVDLQLTPTPPLVRAIVRATVGLFLSNHVEERLLDPAQFWDLGVALARGGRVTHKRLDPTPGTAVTE